MISISMQGRLRKLEHAGHSYWKPCKQPGALSLGSNCFFGNRGCLRKRHEAMHFAFCYSFEHETGLLLRQSQALHVEGTLAHELEICRRPFMVGVFAVRSDMSLRCTRYAIPSQLTDLLSTLFGIGRFCTGKSFKLLPLPLVPEGHWCSGSCIYVGANRKFQIFKRAAKTICQLR